MINPPPALKPMNDFDPFEPAFLHDQRTDRIVTWSGEDAAAYHETAEVHADVTVEWKTYLLDGWGNVLGG